MTNEIGNSDNPRNGAAEIRPIPRALILAGVAIAALLVVGIAAGIYQRAEARNILAAQTEKDSALPVHVLKPGISNTSQELALPGNTQAFSDTAVYARTNGYLEHWYVDIGAHVTRGQILAEIETPEVDRELEQARADMKNAQASESIAQITATRWQNMLQKNAVSKQETDQAISDLASRRAAVESMQANVHRLEQLQSFEKVYAPFSGVITARSTDIGALINAGSSAEPKELFHIAAASQLRVYVAVPESDVSVARSGAKAYLTLDEYPGLRVEGTIARDADAIDSASRTLNVEVDVDNAQQKLRPGAYVTVHFKRPLASKNESAPILLPSNALLFRAEGPCVGIVRNGQALLRPITIGRDFGASIEVTQGLSNNDLVILRPSDSLSNGVSVKVVSMEDGRAK
jgi:RND family efflux transporter MFP subunit